MICDLVLVIMKVQLSLCLSKYHAMKTYMRVEIQIHSFLTSAPVRGEC